MCRPAQSPARSAWAGRAAARGQGQHNKGIAMSVGCTSVCVCARLCEGCIYCAFEHVQVYLCVCRILNENLNVKVTRRLEPSHAESVLQLLLLDLLQLPSSKEKNVKRTQ